MSDTTFDPTRYKLPPGKITYTRFSVGGNLAPEEAGAVVAAMHDAGIADDDIKILTVADRDRFDVPETGGGLRGFFQRLTASTGGDLDLLKAIRRDLDAGLLSIEIRQCADEDRRNQVADILRQHGARHVFYLSGPTIVSLDGEPLG